MALQEREREEAVPAEAFRPAYLLPLVSVEGLGLGKRAAPQQVRAPGGRPAPAFGFEIGSEALDLPGSLRPVNIMDRAQPMTREQELERRIQKLGGRERLPKKSMALKAERRSRTTRRQSS